MKLAKATAIAEGIVNLLRPTCMKAEVAGSIRRQKPEVKDIEIICQPILTESQIGSIDMFSNGPDVPMRLPVEFDEMLWKMRYGRILEYDRHLRRDGARYKRFIIHPDSADHIALDLFIADEGNYGNTLALRTGNQEFSKALVTARRAGGLMPGHLQQKDGYLWYGADRIDCLTEESYFTHLGIEWTDPRFRTADVVKDLIRHSVGGVV